VKEIFNYIILFSNNFQLLIHKYIIPQHSSCRKSFQFTLQTHSMYYFHVVHSSRAILLANAGSTGRSTRSWGGLWFACHKRI